MKGIWRELTRLRFSYVDVVVISIIGGLITAGLHHL